jgi:hypothetical protein
VILADCYGQVLQVSGRSTKDEQGAADVIHTTSDIIQECLECSAAQLIGISTYIPGQVDPFEGIVRSASISYVLGTSCQIWQTELTIQSHTTNYGKTYPI